MKIQFKCSRCGTLKLLRDMWILREPKNKPERFCCKDCFSKALKD